LLFASPSLSALHLPLMLPPEQIHWRVIFGHAPEFVVVAAVSALTILLNASGAGLACRQDPDLDQEMRAAGLANLLNGALGGIVGYQSLSRTLLNHRAGGVARSSGLAAAAGCLIVVLLLPDLIGWMPKSVLVGLQLYIGIGLIQEWLFRSYRKLGRGEYLLIPLIVLVVAVHGVVAGVGLGVVAACVLFVVKYGHISVIRSAFDGRTLNSNVERSIHDTATLREHGGQISGASLHGFLFFATATSILQHVRRQLAQPDAPRYVVLDFHRIDGMDASTSISFLKLRQLCDSGGVTLVLTGLSARSRSMLTRAGLFNAHFQDFDSLDVGLEWVEEQILAAAAPPSSAPPPDGLQAHFTAAALAKLDAVLIPRQLVAGELLFARGAPGDAVYFVDQGRLTVSLPLPEGGALRLRSFGASTVVGEMALYTQNPRSADVRADLPSLVRELSLQALQRLEREDSDTAQQFHRYVVKVLASRLTVANEAVRAAYE
jgi:SulP family sulfate permease